MPIHRFSDAGVKAVFDAYPQMLQTPLRDLRALILDTAAALSAIGPIEESLKWGQPAYRPKKPRTGTTVRIDAFKGEEIGYALFVNCKTTLASDVRNLYPGVFRLEGERAILFAAGEVPPVEPLKHVVALALTYHARERVL